MQSKNDHGAGAQPRKKNRGEAGLRPKPAHATADTLHPALIELVRLLARTAAAEFMAEFHPQQSKGEPS